MRTRLLAAELMLCLAVLAAHGAQAAPGQIYSCVDAKGNKLTSHRPIAACADREQRVLNADGSVRQVMPPTPTRDNCASSAAMRCAPSCNRSRYAR